MVNKVNKVKTAVLPVAGLGTRFLPASKASPKEMLPIVDRPIIQYVVEEAIAAGIENLIFVTSYTKRAIEDYFDSNYELEAALEASGKHEQLKALKALLPAHVNCVYVRQPYPLGLGDAVMRAAAIIKEDYFAILLSDDLIDMGKKSCLNMLVEYHHQVGGNVLAVERVPKSKVDQYGIVSADADGKVSGIVEKPSLAEAPSDLAVVGRYILHRDIFGYLANTKKGRGGEIQLTDALSAMLSHAPFYACEHTGRRYDCGNKADFLKATIAYALKRSELAPGLLSYLKEIVNE
ncbi:MAG: UTP--glucose-1-phosphate uridylyltransferase [Gammaproteobacteria bacterium CG11_big_fil_rev_8_21_14_0_20_46_22]|nr:MAG: UTP--glucose-1-phosphate uridylyltransferase [Gammaproteobacteria bacterium CG12_big_fil_rev_8_21_14_0_65_46_12]PIR10352.1 MAG: UTP--glucose-1-phosphate uridylyltransferase [Gammaproteobacteria bacterium CG11_big_fil_rev_8_21_14_0_20_46_22]